MNWHAKLIFLLLTITNTSVWTMEAPEPQEIVGTKRERPEQGQEERPAKIRKIEVEQVQPTPMEVEPVLAPAPMEIEPIEPAKQKRKRQLKEKMTWEQIIKAKVEREKRRQETKYFNAPSTYYTKNNLEKLRKQGIQLHAPCEIFFDPNNQENSNQTYIGYLTRRLYSTISAIRHTDSLLTVRPLIINNLILRNLLERKESINDATHPENKLFVDFILSPSEWNIYKTPGSQFIILIPKRLLDIYPELAINFHNLKDISHLLSYEKIQNYRILLDEIKTSSGDIVPDLKTIFVTKNQRISDQLPIWDYILVGHGSSASAAYIAGLSPKQINEIFSFMDKELNVGVVYLLTCSAGGKNLNLLQFENSGVRITHNFILIVGATTDAPMRSSYTSNLDPFRFFDLAAQLDDRGESLNKLITGITRFTSFGSSLHGTENIPQVWLPNGIGFQTFNIDQEIFVLNNVLTKAFADQHRPIIINNKKAILVYPLIIPASLLINLKLLATYGYDIAARKKIFFPNMSMVFEPHFWEDITNDKKIKIFEQLHQEFPSINKKIFEQLVEKQHEEFLDNFLYPYIIAMGNKPAYYFHEIILPDNPFKPGVIRFLRDAFLDIGRRTSQKIFLINNLVGYNDISLLIKASRLKKDIQELHPLEKLLAAKKDESIGLDKIVVVTAYDPIKKINYFQINFFIDNTCWGFYQADLTDLWHKTYPWNFRELDPKKTQDLFNKMYDSIKKQTFETLQKPISQTLKEKQAEIKRKQELQKQQKEAAESAIKKWKGDRAAIK